MVVFRVRGAESNHLKDEAVLYERLFSFLLRFPWELVFEINSFRKMRCLVFQVIIFQSQNSIM